MEPGYLFADPDVSQLLAGHYVEHPPYRVLRERGSASWLLIYTVGGEGRFVYRGGEVRSQLGEIALLRPRTLHGYGVAPGAETWELLWAHFQIRPHWEPFLEWPLRGPGLSLLALGETAPFVDERLRDIVRLDWSGRYLDRMRGVALLEDTLILCRQTFGPVGAERDARIEMALRFLHERLEEPIGVADVAREVGLSASRFAHLFQQETGMSPRAFIESRRLDRARELLLYSPLTVRAIAARVGFENEFYFSARFKKYAGHSPREFRELSAEGG